MHAPQPASDGEKVQRSPRRIVPRRRKKRFSLSASGERTRADAGDAFWKERIGRKDDNLFDVATNLRYGCAILRHYLDAYGSLTKALAAYNGSEGSTRYPWKVFAVMRRFAGHR